jgi:hypothetical protein
MRNYIVLRFSKDAAPLWVLADENDDVEQVVGRIVEHGLLRLAEHMEVPGTAIPCPLSLGGAKAWVVDGVDLLVGVTTDIAKAELGALSCETTYSAFDFLATFDPPGGPGSSGPSSE